MTSQRELDRILGSFFDDRADELADRVIDAALDQIDQIDQRRSVRIPRRIQTMSMLSRLTAAAVIGVLAIGAALFVIKSNQSGVGTPSPTPGTTATPPNTSPFHAPSPQPSSPGPLGDGRQIHTETLLAGGRVLVAGGYNTDDGALSSAMIYDPDTGTFSPAGSLVRARGLHTATALSDGRVLLLGGGPASWVFPGPFLMSAELYDPASATFAAAGSMTTTREDHTATLLKDGRVLIAGGNDGSDHATASAEIFDPTTGAFSATGSMTTARGFHTATLLSDGRVLIAGGDTAAWANAGPYLSSAEVFDPATGTFTPTGSMHVGRFMAAAAMLPDGRVLITGGVEDNGTTSLSSAEIYDPTTGTFSPTGSMAGGRVYHTATSLPDGRVMVTGGCAIGRVYANNPHFLASAELYDPATGTFAPTGSMAEGRTWQAATLLTDGHVLVTGGYGDLAALGTAETYDPATGTFSPAGLGN